MANMGDSLPVLEASILHRLCKIMAEERQLHALAAQHPDIDIDCFLDLRSSLINVNREFQRVYTYVTPLPQGDAEIERMEPERV